MKRNAKIFVIISMVIVSISALIDIFASDGVLEIARGIIKEIPEVLEMMDELLMLLKTYLLIFGIIELIGCLAVGTYALLALKNAKSKRSLIAPGILLIFFNGLFGIIGAIMMFCVKPDEFEDNVAEIVQ